MIRLNPCEFVFQDWDNYCFFIYIICEDKEIAENIATLAINEDKYERYFKRPRPTSCKNEMDKFDLLVNEQRTVVINGAIDNRKGDDDEK